ncbi:hypothetical protein RRG08_007368 [Elysia crispata]|uniref:Major facilitator superfamily (MFS) profile domain-containing protein n=1 Tax=Elysia crispata TaxID=231223 RepID=A0AAE1AQR1_9GAST|nr:hypothetical protein RRG08_007368 [Elysia crispata]
MCMSCFFGNVLPYLDSYYHEHRHKISLYISPLWTTSVCVSTFTFGMIFTTPIENRFGINATILVGDIILSFSYISVYFIIREPLALALVFGGLQGASVGIVYALIVKLLLLKLPKHGGLATGLVSGGARIGTVLFIGVSFAVINPSNTKPDLKVGNNVYFSDKKLLNRVPIYFLVLGAITAATTFIGAAFMYIGSCDLPRKGKAKETFTDSDDTVDSQLCRETDACKILTTIGRNEAVPLKDSSAQLYGNPEQEEKVNAEIRTSSTSLNGTQNSEKIPGNISPHDSVHSERCVSSELSPREAPKTARFWLVWLAFVASNHTFFLHLNLYKQYGEQAISDDSMLVTTGIISNISLFFVCPLVGLASDRIGIRNTSIILNAASCLFMSLMVITIHTCPWMYMVLVVIENMGMYPHTMIFSLLTAFEFGKVYCASNMGLIRTGNVPLVLLEPYIVEVLIRTIGWDWLFLTGSLTSIIATVAIMALYRF